MISSTSEGPLEFPFSEERRRGSIQIAVDNSGTATQGNIYLATGTASESRIDVFASTGAFLGKIDQYKEGTTASGSLTAFAERACGVAVDSNGNLYAGDSGGFVHKYDPSGEFPTAADNIVNFSSPEACTLAAGTGPTAGFIFVDSYGGAAGEMSKLDSSTGEVKYTVATGVATVSVDPVSGHVYAIKGTELEELDASGASSASTVSQIWHRHRPGHRDPWLQQPCFRHQRRQHRGLGLRARSPVHARSARIILAGSVEGSAQVGSSLFCAAGSWNGSPTSPASGCATARRSPEPPEPPTCSPPKILKLASSAGLSATNPNGSTVAVNATSSGARYVSTDPVVAQTQLPEVDVTFAGAYGGHVFYTDLNTAATENTSQPLLL